MRVIQTLLLMAVVHAFCPSADGISAEPNDTTPERQTQVTISKKTTYIVEPLRDDGYPDYIAALSRRLIPLQPHMRCRPSPLACRHSS